MFFVAQLLALYVEAVAWRITFRLVAPGAGPARTRPLGRDPSESRLHGRGGRHDAARARAHLGGPADPQRDPAARRVRLLHARAGSPATRSASSCSRSPPRSIRGSAVSSSVATRARCDGGLSLLLSAGGRARAAGWAPCSLFFPADVLTLWTRSPDVARHAAAVLALRTLGNVLNTLMHVPHVMQLAFGWSSLGARRQCRRARLRRPRHRRAGPGAGAAPAPLSSGSALNLAVFLLAMARMHARVLPRRAAALVRQHRCCPRCAVVGVASSPAWRCRRLSRREPAWPGCSSRRRGGGGRPRRGDDGQATRRGGGGGPSGVS